MKRRRILTLWLSEERMLECPRRSWIWLEISKRRSQGKALATMMNGRMTRTKLEANRKLKIAVRSTAADLEIQLVAA
jgi:hypothetical protein